MGICPSNPSPRKRSLTTLNDVEWRSPFSPPSTTVQVVSTKDGKLHLCSDPNLTAQHIISQLGASRSDRCFDRCFLSDSESLDIGLPPPAVPLDEELRPGRIYFLFPESRAGSRISLAELCELAIVASRCLS